MTSFTNATTNYPTGADRAIRRVKFNRPPDTVKNFILGDEWLDTSGSPFGVWWKLSLFTTGGLVWIVIGGAIRTLTGNTGGPVPPDTNANVNVVGDTTTVIVNGNPATSTLTISTGPSVATSYPTDSGTAIPAGGILNVFGDHPQGINTSGAGNTITVHAYDATIAQKGVDLLATDAEVIAGSLTDNHVVNPSSLKAKLGVQTAHSLLVAEGQSSAFTALGVAGNGQLPIGSIGADPVLANITSTGGTITVSNGPGTINIEGPDFPADSGVATPATGHLNILGGPGIMTTGAGNTITISQEGGGGALQQVRATTNSSFANITATKDPNDDNAPTTGNTQLIISVIITPNSASSILQVTFCTMSTARNSTNGGVALFTSASGTSFAASNIPISGGGEYESVEYTGFITAGTTSPLTISTRCYKGLSEGWSIYTLPSKGFAHVLGSAAMTSLSVTEWSI